MDIKPFTWIHVWFFGSWISAWCTGVGDGFVWASVADDAPSRRFSKFRAFVV